MKQRKKPKRKLRIVRDLERKKEQKAGKPKRHIRKSLILVLILCVTAGLLAWQGPIVTANARLRDLGYNDTTIRNIRKQNLQDTILKHKYYSEYLAESINDGSLEKDYIDLYTVVSDRKLEAKDFLLYARLADKGYEEDQILDLFKNLQFYEIVPLLVFDYQWDENPYIRDCKAHEDKNSEDAFDLSGSYLTKYKLTEESDTLGNTDVLVNSSSYLPEAYVPDDLTDIDTQYAVNGVSLVKEAADAFTQMSKASVDAGRNFYASLGYRSYADQNAAYQSLLNQMDQDQADEETFRPGFSEHQTGLAVNVSPTYEKKDFAKSEVMKWLNEHCTEYGFIERYPVGKSLITGVDDEPDHYRYLGRKLAEAVTSTHLTYDEYYALYLADWIEKKDKPKQHILNEADPENSLAEKKS